MQGIPVVTGRRSPRWAIMSRMNIPSKKNAGEIYLSRLRIIQTPWFGVYVHDINEPDFDKDPHDHPWKFTSIVLRGSYTERVWPRPYLRTGSYQRRWNALSWHRMTLEKAHQIESVEPGTISLIFVGRREKNWGFWLDNGAWVAWDKYEGLTK